MKNASTTINISSSTLTILCNDELNPPLHSEHGFSILIEKSGEPTVLFDTGTTDVFIKNASIFGKDLSKVEYIVISHGHYDHAGGLKYLTTFGKKFKVFLRKDAFLPKYSGERFTGIDWESIKDAFEFVIINEKLVKITNSIYAFGPAWMKNNFEEPDPNFQVIKNGEKVRDFFEEELNLVIDEGDGIILITGCAHRGIINIVQDAIELFGKKVRLLIGGFHLYKSPREKIQMVVSILRQLSIEQIIPLHCSGELIREILL
ncbi:MAG: MBL fold metallo-hydrolase [Fervidobacterium pennivorans]|uniref:MBL fold metallo-hydrolase n=1 Tax=Fervidobacterium changbaicum TaxID=310769 RepID=A0ABX5QUB6_9BACT|nr:MBL fold metallo-hydrolase [Fervidobacterium changbaicum]QAV34028.1 MBL fold metallo-hydrolase [Fervidobacterium changbaicum]SDH37739.1 7,8-dihydropterin-6-yl-methyl-4-(beta-D-ribofuranosyl)aminobenzene 5'-phosphate synthase [Fervidobacterium changbaicum]